MSLVKIWPVRYLYVGQDPEKQEGLERIIFNNNNSNGNNNNNKDVMFSAER